MTGGAPEAGVNVADAPLSVAWCRSGSILAPRGAGRWCVPPLDTALPPDVGSQQLNPGPAVTPNASWMDIAINHRASAPLLLCADSAVTASVSELSAGLAILRSTEIE